MSISYHMNIARIIAENEFKAIAANPLVIVVGVIVIFMAFINGYGGYGGSSRIDVSYFKVGQDSFMQGLMQIWYNTVFICNIMAAFLGVISIAKERWTRSINVLLIKPLYKMDIVGGKFAGISVFLFIFISLVLAFTTVMLIIFFKEPLSYYELFMRLLAYIIILTGECSLVAALTMLVGSAVNNLIGSITLVITYIYAEWLSPITSLDVLSFITPEGLLIKMSNPITTSGYVTELFNTLVPFTQWLSDAAPYFIFMMLYIIAVLVINCWAFAKVDDI